jgi:hypothetical protein
MLHIRGDARPTIGGRACGNRPQIARLVGQFDQLGFPTLHRCGFDLSALALVLWKRLVISHFDNDIGDVLAKLARKPF